MSYRHFESTENAELRAKIDEAKPLLPMPDLIRRLGYTEKHIGKTALCPFHNDHHPSFSVFQKNGGWFHRCFVGCSSGDEIAFLVKHFGIPRREAIRRYLDMAGFPTCAPKSHEYPKCLRSRGSPEPLEYPKSPKCPEFLGYPEYPVHPVSNGQGAERDLLAQKDLKGLAARNACTAHNTAKGRRWQLVRDLKAIELRWGVLDTSELMLAFDEWHRFSQPFLDSQKTRDDYLASFLGEFGKVRVPTGEGQTLKTAVKNVSKLSLDQLPEIPGVPNAPKSWRKLLALHRELSRLCGNGIYFLSCRDAGEACGVTHQAAHTITSAFATIGAVEVVSKGRAGLNSGKAAEFRYLLGDNTTSVEEEDTGVEL